MKQKTLRLGLLSIGLALLALAGARAAQNEPTAAPAKSLKKLEYNRDVRPILSENCFACHGPDKKARKAGLRLDDRDAALAKKVFVPGKADESELVKRLFSNDPEEMMPPAEHRKKLTPRQRETLKRWVNEGAEYQPHWAYIPVKRPAVPEVKDAAWARNPIDRFILAELEARKIKPSREADKRTLIRRVSLDLVGLPPTPAEVEAFVKDDSPDAYEKLVDRLLASPHFGERMAVPWLDVVRFADTVGYHGDQNQRIFPYRDYVINAFNSNKPFDQFTIEQLAGDLLPNPTTEQLVATGFNRLNMMTREGGAQPKEYLAKYQADRVRTVSMAWLGSTMGCCECHDHKFDPFATRDFYSMEAFFADVRQWGVYHDYGYTPNPDLRGWSNDHPFPPEIQVDSPYLKQRIDRLNAKIDALVAAATDAKLKDDEKERAKFDTWRESVKAFLAEHADEWATALPVEDDALAATQRVARPFALNGDGSLTFRPPALEDKTDAAKAIRPAARRAMTDSESLELKIAPGWIAAVSLELLPDGEGGGSVFRNGAANTNVQFAASLKSAKDKGTKKLAFYHADADHKEDRYANGFDIIGVRDVWVTSKEHTRQPQRAVYLLDPPVQTSEGDTLVVKVSSQAPLARVRISTSPLATGRTNNPGLGEWMRQALQGLGENEVGADARMRRIAAAYVRRTYLTSTAWDAPAFAQFKKVWADVLECRDGRAWTMVTEAWKPPVTRVLPRGNWQDESGAEVEPAPPHFLSPNLQVPEGKRLTRLDLAKWLVSRDNPLTARTFVNRLWKQYFGAGLSAVVDDLGAQGEPPSHPDLLDWLAAEFMDPSTSSGQAPSMPALSERSESKWDVKHMVRLIVTSETYRQDSNPRPELKEIDPNNRLLAYQNPMRLEAEFVRDNALSIAGLLNPDVGGPSSHPYQPAGYYAQIQFPDRDYYPEKDERQFRRGVYSHWQRTFLHPMLANFDAPSREECVAFRVVSNTPQQALTLLNDPEFVEAARVFGERLLTEGGKGATDEQRIDRAFRTALARPAKEKEKASLSKFLAEQREEYRARVEDAAKLTKLGTAPKPEGVDFVELAAWTSVCRVVLNLHETITRY